MNILLRQIIKTKGVTIIMKKTKSIAAIAMAAMLAASVATTTVTAVDTTYVSGLLTAQTLMASTGSYSIPTKIFMTEYMSGNASRTAKANATINAAKSLLASVKYTELSLPNGPSFDSVSLMVGSTKYDYLIKANAENGATVLTFDSESNLKSAMSKIRTEEQTIMNAALLPYRNYIDAIISNGAYTKANANDSADVKAIKVSNAALLNAAKNMLAYTYTDADLFSGDVTGKAKTYQIGYLSAATIGTSSAQTVVSNDEEFTNFPKLILNSQTIDWGDVHHLDVFNNSNNSWWFALKDGNTLNNDYYWLKGMMIPDFADTISFDAYAGTEWQQFNKTPNGSGSNNNSGGNNNGNSGNNGGSGNTAEYNGASYYYNTAYNYVSGVIYSVTDGYNTFYYPNYAYARAAIAADSSRYLLSSYTSSHSSYMRYFSFIDGCYYASAAQSPYPYNTVYMRDDSSTTTTPSASDMSYYFNNGNVYDKNNNLIGNAASRGYSSTATWFCTTDGRFYSAPIMGKAGYYVSSNDSGTVDMNDPYYQYWTEKLAELRNNSNKNTGSNSNKNNSSSSDKNKNNNKNNSTSTTNKTYDEEIIADDDITSTSISATALAALRASGDTVSVKPLKSATWTISGENVTTPHDINLKITYKTNNIPAALKKAARKDCPYSLTMTIGENLKWGTNATLSIKFKKERANFIAKLYRYDTATSTLVLVNTSTVGNTGKVSFNNVDRGGEYYITLG